MILLSDCSVDPKSNVGYGAYLFIEDIKNSLEELKSKVKLKRFENTTSTKLELQTLLWALNEIEYLNFEVIVFTDSQNILSLPKRRIRFEKNNYKSKRNKLLANSALYQEFFRITDRMNCTFVKVQGHKPSKYKDGIDKASRSALRNDN